MKTLPQTISYILNTLAIGIVLTFVAFALFPDLRNNNLLWNKLFSQDQNNQRPISYAKAVAKAAPAVVNIYSEGFQTNRFVNTAKRKVQRLGSGVIVSNKGFILTAEHVVKNAELIRVALQDGRTFEAQLIGADPATDLAVLYVEANNLPVISTQNRYPIQPGDLVLAIGNPYNLGQTITQGIISATGRSGLNSSPDINLDYSNFIQMDAAINDGNSGGALVNSNGDLVGISSAKLANRLRNKAQGIFFAVDAKLALEVMDKIIADGRVVRGYLGISGSNQQLSASDKLASNAIGIRVTDLDPIGPAAKAGMQVGDVIIQLAGQAILNPADALQFIEETKPGTQVPLVILRKNVKLKVTATVIELPTKR
ncbi:trypsin-like peptidase domain-containing protein [Catenovulum sp. SM1970]|uniref:trypsin-like peptidase domain-containing protein n=1 Tax=Marinifaba aquimaris TaxID=2741323 RepID=UPI0015732612|nr:trypsin-like peptidase domain-containing protein [Marinifaba aquimaris]NTS75904.1 trypsin-like peptidase domain-containing protein [Marinifaba aquimaris]